MKSSDIRAKFFDYFKQRGHEQVTSSSLIPAQDPTLLFANAGMNQFKDVFLGKEKRSYKRAVTIQKCVRAGGKHNDLDNVGFTKRHLTFFEMMGNFSFGDYFKKEAIHFAWDFLTKEMNLPVENLHATVYTTDDESYDIWHKEIGIPTERMWRLGEADNFWQMGDTGPCGPCTEIHIDRGPEMGCKDIKDCGPACNCDRFLEIWNNVFMQFDRQPDGTDKPLKQTGVDTGMGFERLCSVVQDKDSVYETDVFGNIIAKIEELTDLKYTEQNYETKAAFNVLADHIRSSSMIIADGGAPSNDGRGYVLRKIIRRAALFAKKLTDKDIFPELSKVVVADFGAIYPELITNKEIIFKILASEIEKFSTNLVRGQNFLEKFIAQHTGSKTVPGTEAFKLYDTFGFPLELIHLVANEKGFNVDTVGFDVEMKKQQEQSTKKVVDELAHVNLGDTIKTEHRCYQELETAATIVALVVDGKVANSVSAGQLCWVIADKSPFFIEGGGQVTDQGWINVNTSTMPLLGAKKINGAIGAQVKATVAMNVGDAITSRVNKELRITAMKNHTATHLLQSALIALFGKQIKQSGSLVTPDYLRFDFTYHENLKPEDIIKVEALVNQKITENIATTIEYTTLKDATNRGVIAFFGDKYNPEQVRVVEIPGFSAELCGGTHVQATGEIGCFKITEVTALSAGHRRIFAVTGPKAIELFQQDFGIVKNLCQEFAIKPDAVIDTVHKQRDQIKELQTQLKSLKKQSWQSQIGTWEKQTTNVGNIPFLFLQVSDLTNDELKEIATLLSSKKPGLYFLISSDATGKSTFLCKLSSQFTTAINLKNFAAWLKDTAGLRGGGSADTVQGGGEKVYAGLEEQIKNWLQKNG